MYPFTQTKAEIVVSNSLRWLGMLAGALHLQNQVDIEYNESAIETAFLQAETDAGASTGNTAVYGGYDTRDVRRWRALGDAWRDFLASNVTTTFADTTTETVTAQSLIARLYAPYQE